MAPTPRARAVACLFLVVVSASYFVSGVIPQDVLEGCVLPKLADGGRDLRSLTGMLNFPLSYATPSNSITHEALTDWFVVSVLMLYISHVDAGQGVPSSEECRTRVTSLGGPNGLLTSLSSCANGATAACCQQVRRCTD